MTIYRKLYGKTDINYLPNKERNILFACWVSTKDSILSWSLDEQHRGQLLCKSSDCYRWSYLFLLQFACLSSGKPHDSIQNSSISSSSFCFFLYSRPVIMLKSYKSCGETWKGKGSNLGGWLEAYSQFKSENIFPLRKQGGADASFLGKRAC